MDPAPVIFDISSDDEPTPFSEHSVGDDDHNWLAELLQTVDRGTDDSDDVVVVGEYTPTKPKSKSCRSYKPVVKDYEDDDDCVILDGDPDKPDKPAAAAAAAAKDTSDGDGDGDEVLVVAETGQVACRDYPHSRHLCLKFGFSSTLHAEHCDLCHCYVCDSVAPCAYWGTGLSSSDHCHATDKQQMWKTMRESFRKAKDGGFTVSKVANTLPEACTQVNQLPRFENMMELAANSATYSQVRKPTTLRPCSSVVPNIISRSRPQQTGHNHARNGFFPQRSLQPALGVRDSMIRRDRGSQIGNLGPHIVSSGMKNQMFGGGGFRTAQALYGTSDGMNFVSGATYARNGAGPLGLPKDFGSADRRTTLPNMGSVGSSQPDINPVANALASVSEVFPQPVYQSNNSQNVCQLGYQTTSVADSGLLDFNFNWVDEISNRQSSVEAIHHNGMVYNEDRSKVDQSSSQFPVNSGLHYQDDNYGSCSLGQSLPVASEGCLTSDLNLFSPEPAAIDAGVLCTDFETSWTGMTHN